MKPLTFRHTFSSGLEVTLRCFRAPSGNLLMTADKKNFHKGIESEYEEWLLVIARQIHALSTDDERTLDFIEGLERISGNK